MRENRESGNFHQRNLEFRSYAFYFFLSTDVVPTSKSRFMDPLLAFSKVMGSSAIRRNLLEQN